MDLATSPLNHLIHGLQTPPLTKLHRNRRRRPSQCKRTEKLDDKR